MMVQLETRVFCDRQEKTLHGNKQYLVHDDQFFTVLTEAAVKNIITHLYTDNSFIGGLSRSIFTVFPVPFL